MKLEDCKTVEEIREFYEQGRIALHERERREWSDWVEAGRPGDLSKNIYADALCSLMSGISEDAYAAGWMSGLEYDLWDAREHGPRSYGMIWISSYQCKALYQLSELAGGWETAQGFVPMAEWLVHLKERENG